MEAVPFWHLPLPKTNNDPKSPNRLFMKLQLKTLLATALLTVGLNACTLIERTAELPYVAVATVAHEFSGGSATYDPVELQENILRYAGTFINAVIDGTEKLEKNGQPVSREFMVLARLRMASDVVSLATGSNSLSNLISLMIYTRSIRISLDEFWGPKEFGDSVRPLLSRVREREKNITEIADGILTRDQMNDVLKAVDEWHSTHNMADPQIGDVASVSLVNQIIRQGSQSKTSDNSGSVFALLNLDPLAGLDPATRELTETRLFGERALFMGQYMPQMVEWQMELLTTRTSRVPEVRKLIENATTLTLAGDQIGKTAAELPNLIRTEREKVLSALKDQQGSLAELAKEMAVTMGQGSAMAVQTDLALKTFQGIIDTFKNWPVDPNSKTPPFNVLDYAETASQIASMSAKVSDLLQNVHSASGQQGIVEMVQAIQKQAEVTSQYLMKQFLLLILLSSLIIAGVTLGTLMLYKSLSKRYF